MPLDVFSQSQRETDGFISSQSAEYYHAAILRQRQEQQWQFIEIVSLLIGICAVCYALFRFRHRIAAAIYSAIIAVLIMSARAFRKVRADVKRGI